MATRLPNSERKRDESTRPECRPGRPRCSFASPRAQASDARSSPNLTKSKPTASLISWQTARRSTPAHRCCRSQATRRFLLPSSRRFIHQPSGSMPRRARSWRTVSAATSAKCGCMRMLTRARRARALGARAFTFGPHVVFGRGADANSRDGRPPARARVDARCAAGICAPEGFGCRCRRPAGSGTATGQSRRRSTGQARRAVDEALADARQRDGQSGFQGRDGRTDVAHGDPRAVPGRAPRASATARPGQRRERAWTDRNRLRALEDAVLRHVGKGR